MTFKTALIFAAAAGLLASGASAAPKAKPTADPARQCFWANSISSYAAPDNQTVNLRVGVKDVYRMDLFGTCPDVDWGHAIAIRSRGGSLICSGMDAEVISRSSIGVQRCAVRNVHKLTDAEVAALPKQGRP